MSATARWVLHHTVVQVQCKDGIERPLDAAIANNASRTLSISYVPGINSFVIEVQDPSVKRVSVHAEILEELKSFAGVPSDFEADMAYGSSRNLSGGGR